MGDAEASGARDGYAELGSDSSGGAVTPLPFHTGDRDAVPSVSGRASAELPFVGETSPHTSGRQGTDTTNTTPVTSGARPRRTFSSLLPTLPSVSSGLFGTSGEPSAAERQAQLHLEEETQMAMAISASLEETQIHRPGGAFDPPPVTPYLVKMGSASGGVNGNLSANSTPGSAHALNSANRNRSMDRRSSLGGEQDFDEDVSAVRERTENDLHAETQSFKVRVARLPNPDTVFAPTQD